MCPACSPGLARPRRLKGWAFALGFWCERHRRLLFGPGQHGTGVLGNEAAARRGAKLLKDWTMGQNDRAIPVDAAVSLLLSPCRESSPPAPWELARLSEAARKGRGDVFTRPCRRAVLGIIVPEFNTAVPIYDQRVPKTIFALRDAPLAVAAVVRVSSADTNLLNSLQARSEFIAGFLLIHRTLRSSSGRSSLVENSAPPS
jgi:hypothetical protein